MGSEVVEKGLGGNVSGIFKTEWRFEAEEKSETDFVAIDFDQNLSCL